MQPNVDFVKPDRGWTLLDSVKTDANGSASYSLVLSMMGGCHGLEARFVGDQDFGSSRADTQFDLSYRPTMIRIVEAQKTVSSVSVVLKLTDPSGFPLGGKVLSFEALGVTAQALYAVTNDTGHAVMNFRGLVQSYVDSKITVLGDDYISRYQTFVRLVQNGSGMSVAAQWGESGVGSLAIGEGETRPADAAAFSAHETGMLTPPPSDIAVWASPADATVDLPETIDSGLVLNSSAGGLTFDFFVNGTYEGSNTANSTRIYDDEYGWVYVYSATFFWIPDVYGNYSVDVLARDSSNQTIGLGNVSVSVGRAYSNLIVYYPGAFSGDSMSIVVAFAKARTQNQTNGSDYFQTINFAPTISWGNDTYALDQPTGMPPIGLYLNGNETDLYDTAGTGVCGYNYTSSAFPSGLNITVAINQTSRFQGNSVSQVFNLTHVSVLNDPTVAANPQTFYMNYSLSVLNGTDTTYVNSNNVVETQVTVLNRTACNVVTSFTAGYLGNRIANNATGFLTIPAGFNYTYLRVVSACNASGTPLLNPWADINKDGKVDIKDISAVAKCFGKNFGYAGYNWTRDVNADGKIDIKDYSAVAKDFGQNVTYLPNGAYSPNFDSRGIIVNSDAGPVLLDSRGFATVPVNATWLSVPCKADVEFFNSTSNGSAVTDNGGRADVTWNAPFQGVYVAEAWLTSPLNLTVAVNSAPTQMNASLCMANYYYVFKRPVDISLSWDDQLQSTTLTTCADTYVDSGFHHSCNFGDYLYVLVGGNGEYTGFIRFDLSSIPADAHILSAKLNVYEYSFNGAANYGVHKVLASWNELSLTYDNMPNYTAGASSTLNNVPSQEGMWLSFNVTSDVRYWSNASNPNYGFALVGDPSSSANIVLYSKEYASSKPSLEISYLKGSQDVLVNAYDEALQTPAQVNVNLYVNGALNSTQYTNQSGLWDAGSLWPSTSGVWNLTANSVATGECASGTASNVMNLGLPTSLASLDGNVTSMSQNSIVSNFTFRSSDLFGVGGVTVNFFVNGTYLDGTAYSCAGSNTTMANGTVRFGWNVDQGTFSVHAVFGGDAEHMPSDAYELVIYNTTALSVLFSISPAQFTPETTITLNATLINPLDGSRYTTPSVNVEFFNFSSTGSVRSMGTNVSVDGVALYSLWYPNDTHAYAYNATVLNRTDNGKTVSTVVSSPVQLTVGQPDDLVSTAIINLTSTTREIEYYFAPPNERGNNLWLGGRQVKIKINNTEEFYCTTESTFGIADLTRDFPAINNATTTYIITASFAGDSPVSASANSTALDGKGYASCTTAQYNGYEPSTNTIVLTVDPQSILAATLTKTPDEMQKEAEQSGTLRVWHEFSWLPPWYRVHFVSVYEESDQFDQGISPIPFVGATLTAAGPFLNTLSTLWWRIVWPIAGTIMGAEFFAQLASNAGPEMFLVALGVSQGLKWGSLWTNWNNVNGLVSALIGNVFATAMGLVRSGFGFAVDFLKLLLELTDIAAVGFGNLYRICSFPANIFYIGTIMNRLHELGAIA